MNKNKENFELWLDKYLHKPVINVQSEFTEKELKILKDLKIEIKEGEYTEAEFEELEMKIGEYYKDDTMSLEELAMTKELEPTGITQEEYNKLIEKISKINLKYQF